MFFLSNRIDFVADENGSDSQGKDVLDGICYYLWAIKRWCTKIIPTLSRKSGKLSSMSSTISHNLNWPVILGTKWDDWIHECKFVETISNIYWKQNKLNRLYCRCVRMFPSPCALETRWLRGYLIEMVRIMTGRWTKQVQKSFSTEWTLTRPGTTPLGSWRE